MRQVPEFEPLPLGVVGDGRVARQFRHYFGLLGLPVCAWSRRAAGPPPPIALASCRTILLLIRDDAIVPFVESWPELRSKRLVHCAGSLVTPVASAAHPLMSFGSDLYEEGEYRTVPFIVDAGGPSLRDLIPGLPNPSYAIAAAERPYYHALCVLAGNCSTILWLKLFRELEQRFGLPGGVGHPYLARVAANIAVHGDAALTGPLVRGDAGAIASNLRALDGDPFQAVYAAFVRAHDQRA